VEEANAIRRGSELRHRVPPTHRDPVDVELEVDLRRELGEENVPDRRAVEWSELEVVLW
jgi:hypothetical protein